MTCDRCKNYGESPTCPDCGRPDKSRTDKILAVAILDHHGSLSISSSVDRNPSREDLRQFLRLLKSIGTESVPAYEFTDRRGKTQVAARLYDFIIFFEDFTLELFNETTIEAGRPQ